MAHGPEARARFGETLGVAELPLEVIEQRPIEESPHIRSPRERSMNGRQVRTQAGSSVVSIPTNLPMQLDFAAFICA